MPQPAFSVRPASCTLFRMSSMEDRKSTRLNSSHVEISYAVFCLKKKRMRATQRNRTGFDSGSYFSIRRLQCRRGFRSFASHLHRDAYSDVRLFFFFFNDAPTPEIYTLSLHDALPICRRRVPPPCPNPGTEIGNAGTRAAADRKSTRLNSSHVEISYAVFCLKKKK